MFVCFRLTFTACVGVVYGFDFVFRFGLLCLLVLVVLLRGSFVFGLACVLLGFLLLWIGVRYVMVFLLICLWFVFAFGVC